MSIFWEYQNKIHISTNIIFYLSSFNHLSFAPPKADTSTVCFYKEKLRRHEESQYEREPAVGIDVWKNEE